MRGIHKRLQCAFSKIKEEFDDHLNAINENTNEIQSNYEYICKLDAKIDKLSEQIDELKMMFHHALKSKIPGLHDFPESIQLTPHEKEVFLELYKLNGDKGTVTYQNLARNTGFSEALVMNYVTTMIAKGVPIIKAYKNGRVSLKIDDEFRYQQAKRDIVGLRTVKRFN
ncbi:hypothetical protein D6745_01295 [Candidatus Woesearchaeota archaeon]|nr:MAG: hypothetical protein D6745_01295 [Candidatus Woesearchaeota archaeon]